MKLSKLNAKYANGGKLKQEWQKQKEWKGNPSLGYDSYMKKFSFGSRSIPVYVWGSEKAGWSYTVSAGANSELSHTGAFPENIAHGNVESAMKFADELFKSGKLIYAKGGKIENQYKGKTPQQVWDSWTKDQKIHFVSDHEILSDYRKEGKVVHDKKYKNLPSEVKGVLKYHIEAGQYAEGGKPVGSTGLFSAGGYTEEDGDFSINVHGDKPTDYKIVCKTVTIDDKKVMVCYHERNDKEKIGVEVYSGQNYVVGSKEKSYSRNFPIGKVPKKYDEVVAELKKEHQRRSKLEKFADGGKPVGSTGLFSYGGKTQSAKNAKKTTIYYIDNGEVNEGNLYDFVIESAREVTSPRGVMPQYIVERVETLEDGDEEPVVKWAIKKWTGHNGNGPLKTVESFDTEEEAEDQLFTRVLNYDFQKDDQRNTMFFYTKEEAEGELKDRESYADGGKPVGSTGLFSKGGVLSISGQYITLLIKKGGNLHLSITKEGEDWIKENGPITEHNFSDVFEDISANSEIIYFQDASNVGIGMTNSPIITDGYHYGDSGDLEPEEDSRVWWYPDYMIHDPFEKLTKEGEVTFQAEPEDNDEEFAKGGQPLGSTGLFSRGGVPDYDNRQNYDDYHLAHSVELFGENSNEFYKKHGVPVMRNMKKKLVDGKFDMDKAIKGCLFYINEADKKYQKDVMDRQPRGYVLSEKDRKLLAKGMAAFAKAEFEVNGLDAYAKGGDLSDDRIDTIVHHYAVAALWSSMDDDENLDTNYSISDIAEKTMSDMRNDVKKFVKENSDTIKESGLTDEQIGHSLWLSRNGHGAGFFDFGTEAADKLQEAARSMGEINLEVGDDKKIHSMQSYSAGGTIMAERIVNAEANVYSENKIPFRGNDLEGKILDNGDYVVLSFGYLPIWYWCAKTGTWYGNSEKYSVPSSKQQTQSRPDWNATMMPLRELLEQMKKDQEVRYDLGGAMIRTGIPLTSDNTLGAHAGSAALSQNIQ